MIRWFARNDIASNFLIIAILLWGGYSAIHRVPLEVQPAITFNEVQIDVPYRGGSPSDVERAVIIPIESALIGLQGVDQIVSTARTGSARIEVIANDGVDPKDLIEEIKARVDRITTFPQEIEPPRVRVPDSTLWFDVIKIAVAGDMDQNDLTRAAERVRDDMINMPEISQSFMQGVGEFEIAIEADPKKLRDYGLTFSDLSNAIRRSSVDLPAGRIQTDEGSLIIRSKGQAYTRSDFESIVIQNNDGAEINLGKVATVKDGFEEGQKLIRFNGKPCMLIEALRLNDENALKIANAVKEYQATAHERFPEGITLHIWDDSSVELEGRLGTLLWSLAQGCLLVLITLGLFLRPSIALWVTIGIPVAFAGGFILMPHFGITANVMSLFGFIIVVGIIVDDAIVTAENVYTKLQDGMERLEAATLGTKEVATPVTFGVITTIVAFAPLMFIDGSYYSSFAKQIPPVVTAVLVFSLIESKLCLPSHLKHVRVNRGRLNFIERFQKKIADGLELFVKRCYEPSLRLATHHRYTTLAIFFAVGMAFTAYFKSGALGFDDMPSMDRNRIVASVRMTRDTKIEVTEERVKQVEAALVKLKEEFTDPGTGKSLIEDVLTSSGGWPARSHIDPHVGYVVITVTDPGERSEPGPKNSVIADRWTELIGEMPDVASFWVSGDRGSGFKGGDNDMESIEIEVRGNETEAKRDLVREIEQVVEAYDGISSAWSTSGGVRDELQITITPEGEALRLNQRDLAQQVRAAFFGEQAQRMQRDRDDVRVMVRLPLEQRQTLDTLNELRIRTPDGGDAPFNSVASATFTKSRARIDRVDGAQVITIYCNPEDETVNIVDISRDLTPRLDALVNQHPELSWRYTGYVAEHEETYFMLIFGGIGLLAVLYALLAIPFKSLYQPIFVMIAVPFGAIGALIGHMILDITPSYLSMFGILALSGVVVNDSLVMVDFINKKKQAGEDLFTAVIHSGTRRFRPIFLTSITTFAGLLPILSDPSLQAQLLIPMAASLAFGILFATVITLYLIPTAYVAAEDIRAQLAKAWNWYWKPMQREDA